MRDNTPITVSTLNPSRIIKTDYLDLSRRLTSTVRFPKSVKDTYTLLRYHNGPERTVVPFPDQVAGFLYYHDDEYALPLEGSVRLRLTADYEPSSFPSGQDLTLPSGAPWQIILPRIACGEQHATLCAQLRRERLVTSKQLWRARRIFRYSDNISPHLTLFRLSQQFPVDFSESLKLTAVGKTLLHPLIFDDIFRDDRGMMPWTGMWFSTIRGKR
jgi:hypothetical protein